MGTSMQLRLRPGAARQVLQAGLKDLEGQAHEHQANRPAYPPAAAGEGFAEYGARLAQAYELVHRRQAAYIERTASTLGRAHRQVDEIVAADGSVASQIARVLP